MNTKITIEVSEAYDRLSVLFIKLKKCLDYNKKEQIRLQIENLESEINISIKRDLAEKIFKSPEYQELYKVNLELFEIIDKVKLGGIDALIPFNLNNQRFEAKNNLQKKFFGKETGEIKLL